MPTYYIPVAGTWGASDGWVIKDDDPFTLFARESGLAPRRRANGEPWNWSTRLAGLWWTDPDIWSFAASDLAEFVGTIPYLQRNFIAASHGGNIVLLAAARGLRIRTLTTLGTPVRPGDVPAAKAALNIGYWQHLYDLKWDFMGTLRKRLGKVGDHELELERRFLIPGVHNFGVPNIGHMHLVTQPDTFHLWKENYWFDAIKNGPAFDTGETLA